MMQPNASKPTRATRGLKKVNGWLLFSLMLMTVTGGAVAIEPDGPGTDGPEEEGNSIAIGSCRSPQTYRHIAGSEQRDCVSERYELNPCLSGGITIIEVYGFDNDLCFNGYGSKCSYNQVTVIRVHGNGNVVCSGQSALCNRNVELTIYVTGVGNIICSGWTHEVCDSGLVTILNTGYGNQVCNKGNLFIDNSVRINSGG